jgi:hypothetical protein
MLRFLLILALAVSVAPAASVTFSTSTTQICIGSNGCGTSLQTFPDNLFIVFNDVISDTFTVTPGSPSRVLLGTVAFGCLDSQQPCDLNTAIPDNLNIYLTVNQSSPTNGVAAFGLINPSGTFANPNTYIFFPPFTVQNGDILWQLDTLNFSRTFLPDQTIVEFFADVSDTSNPAVPEPSTYALSAAGLGALVYLRRRR